jgi:hypothetical protein
MKATLTLFVILLIYTFLARADDITTLKGEKLVGVTISRVEPDGLVVIKSDGIVKIPFTELPPEVRTKYGYDPQKAAQFSAALQAADAQRQAETARQLAAANATAATQQQQEEIQNRAATQSQQLHVEVTQVLANGILADPLEEHYIPGRASSMARIGGGGGVGSDAVSYEPSGKTIFVQGLSGMAENERATIQAYRDGTYTYSDTSGASRTIEKWIFVKKLGK